MKKIFYKDLYNFSKIILNKVNLDDFSNEAVSEGICLASLRGVDSHGIKLLPHYVRCALNGQKNPKPNFKFNKKFPAFGLLDADNAFGLAAGFKAIDLCIEICQQMGVGVVSVNNSSHPGAMASITLKASKKGFIGIGLTNANSLLISYNGNRSFFGTNPISMTAPRVEEDPYCLDMATSIIPWNKLMNLQRYNKNIDENVAADKDGNMTINSNEASFLYPVGGYKGYGLASMVEILCSILGGMPFGRNIVGMFNDKLDKPRHISQFYIVLRTDIFGSEDDFKIHLQNLTDQVRNEPSKENKKVLLPNDPEIEISKKRAKNGIPLDEHLYNELLELSDKYNVKLVII